MSYCHPLDKTGLLLKLGSKWCSKKQLSPSEKSDSFAMKKLVFLFVFAALTRASVRSDVDVEWTGGVKRSGTSL